MTLSEDGQKVTLSWTDRLTGLGIIVAVAIALGGWGTGLYGSLRDQQTKLFEGYAQTRQDQAVMKSEMANMSEKINDLRRSVDRGKP